MFSLVKQREVIKNHNKFLIHTCLFSDKKRLFQQQQQLDYFEYKFTAGSCVLKIRSMLWTSAPNVVSIKNGGILKFLLCFVSLNVKTKKGQEKHNFCQLKQYLFHMSTVIKSRIFQNSILKQKYRLFTLCEYILMYICHVFEISKTKQIWKLCRSRKLTESQQDIESE